MSDEPQTASGEEGPSYFQPTTTAEAQKYARTILDKQIGGGNQKGEAAILDEMKQNSQRAISALRQAQQSMAGVQYDTRPNQANVAAALLAPTRSGTSSEGIGKAFEAYGTGLQSQRNFELERLKAVLGYQQQIAEQPNELTKTKLDLQKLHEQQEGPLGKEALTVLGRSIIPGSGVVSPNGRKAASEGLQVGTQPYFKRVRQLDAIDARNAASTAGTDADSYTEPDRSEQAYKYGVPSEAPYPWVGSPTKERRQMLQTERVSSEKMLNELQSHVDQAQQIQRDLNRFGYLNKTTNTSSFQGVPGVNFITGFGEGAKEMDKISSRLGPLMRQPGMGRMTNMDLTTFLAATVGRDKPKAVNDSIRTAMGTAIENQLDYNQFMHSFFAVHRTLQGGPEAWQEYLLANPIFDPTAEEGSFKLNKGRLKYKEYFRSLTAQGHEPAAGGSSGPSQFPDVTEEDRDDPAFEGLSDEQIHGAKQPAHARGGAIRGYAKGGKVKREDDYKATLEDLARSLEQGAGFQWGDELNAAVSPGPYSENIQSERGQQERFSGSHPWSNMGLEAAGGMGTSIAAAKLAKLATEHARGKAGALGAAASLASRLMPTRLLPKAAVIGAGAGAISGAGSAQDVEHIPEMAAEHGAIGAVAGPLASLVTKYGVNGAMVLIDKLRGRGVPAGAQKVLSALQGDRTTVDEIASRLRASQRQGVPSMVSDVGGPRVQALAQGVASKEGPKVTAWTDALRARQAGSNGRVQELVNRALKPDDYQTKLTELTTNLYNQAKPLYEQAYSQFPKVKSTAINDILATPSGKKAAKVAFQLMKDAGIPIGKADVSGIVRKPSLQYLDYLKRALDDQIEKSTRSGNLNQARVIKGMRNNLRDELDTVTEDGTGNSVYKQARQQYAGDMEVLDALKMGRDEFSKLTPAEIKQRVANMSFAEKDALRTGVAEGLFQKIGNTPLTNNAATPLANIPNMQEKLSAMFDKPGDYQSFMQGMMREMQNFNQAKTVLSTQARSAAAGASADLEPAGHVGEAAYEGILAASGHPLWAGARLAKQAGNALMRNPTADAAAELMAIQNNPTGRTQLDMLRQQAARLASRQGTGNLAAVGAAGATGPMQSPEPWDNTESQ